MAENMNAGGGWLPPRALLDELHTKYNRREFVHPDPLEFLYRYENPADREIVGFVAASLAYGRVAQTLKSVARVLERMPSPLRFLRGASLESLRRTFAGFKHRWTTSEELSSMLFGLKRLVEKYGSLRACFTTGLREEDDTVVSGIHAFARKLTKAAGGSRNSLIASAAGSSACKRFNLFLRWMVRQDEVDPGGWEDIAASRLVVPLDAHIHKIALGLQMTRRRAGDMATALEITSAFRKLVPEDPVRYDFALTRLGIREDGDPEAFVRQCRAGQWGGLPA